MAGMAIDGVGVLMGAGLFVERRTLTLMQLVLGSAILNVVLNVALIPSLGIVGAALATLVSYAALALAMAACGARWLPVRIPWGGLVRASLASVVMYQVVSRLDTGGRLGTIAVRVAVGIVVYALLLVVVEPRARDVLRAMRERITR
jgi:O-antigen/teichoic acid export membrane protein